MNYTEFIYENRRWLGGGFLLTLASCFGQTFFIALFSGELRATFDLSHGELGGLYTGATLASAVVLIWLGKTADWMHIPVLSAIVIGVLAAACLLMASAGSLVLLTLALFLLRLLGQGMLTHIAMTAMGRWFSAYRGRAVGVASLGFSAGEAVLPFITIVLIGAMGWRQVWLAAAAILLLAALPAIYWLFRVSRTPVAKPSEGMARYDNRRGVEDWTRRQVLADPVFYGLLPATLGPPFISTGIFFHQIHLMDEKGWDISVFPAVFPFFAASTVITSLASGWAIDRWNSVVLLPIFLLPLGLGSLFLGLSGASAVAGVFMVLLGVTIGAGQTMSGAIWPELYGTTHLGAIRALMAAVMVFGTALAPGIVGWLLDIGVTMETQLLFMAGYTVAASGFLWYVMRVIQTARSSEAATV
ncbi:MAG: MFS transporter [Pseudomonadota bacterium]